MGPDLWGPGFCTFCSWSDKNSNLSFRRSHIKFSICNPLPFQHSRAFSTLTSFLRILISFSSSYHLIILSSYLLYYMAIPHESCLSLAACLTLPASVPPACFPSFKSLDPSLNRPWHIFFWTTKWGSWNVILDDCMLIEAVSNLKITDFWDFCLDRFC